MTSKNERAKQIVGLRIDEGLALDFPWELGFKCPVCGEDGEKLHWSEYETFIWCMTCDKDYPSVLCMPEIDDAIGLYLNSVDYLKKERSLK